MITGRIAHRAVGDQRSGPAIEQHACHQVADHGGAEIGLGPDHKHIAGFRIGERANQGELIRRAIHAREGRAHKGLHGRRRARNRLDRRIQRAEPAKGVGYLAGQRAF